MHDAAKRYRKDGFIVGSWDNGALVERLNAVCRDIYEKRINNGYSQKVKYEEKACEVVLDHKYDPVLLDILFQTDVTRFMQQILGSNAMLARIQAITSLPPGYVTEWHSDGHYRTVHKLLYYPMFGDCPEPCVELMPGHVKSYAVYQNRILTNRCSSWLEAAFSKKRMIRSSNSNFVVLNTGTMHRAVPVRNSTGVFRLIYSFVDWFDDDAGRNRLTATHGPAFLINEDLVKQYRSRVGGLSLPV